MKLAKMYWQDVVKWQNVEYIPQGVIMNLRKFNNRCEVSFTLPDGKKMPFLFRVGIEGNNPCFVSLPHYLEYSRATCQLPDELKSLVFDIRNLGIKRAENMFYMREFWKIEKRN